MSLCLQNLYVLNFVYGPGGGEAMMTDTDKSSVVVSKLLAPMNQAASYAARIETSATPPLKLKTIDNIYIYIYIYI
jgi:hypothetical protein